MGEALAFLHRLEEDCADRIEPFACGRGFFCDARPRVWDFTFLRVEHGEPDADELVAAANELMVGLEHRRVVVDDAALAVRLGPGFPAHGWTTERHLVMEHRRAAEPGRAAEAREASPDELEPFWAELTRLRGYELNKRSIVEAAVPTRYFAGFVDGAPVSCCDLYSRDGVGQVEDVATLEAHRNQGLASAAVLAAVAASLADGNTLTFLVADADDWPYRLYELSLIHI